MADLDATRYRTDRVYMWGFIGEAALGIGAYAVTRQFWFAMWVSMGAHVVVAVVALVTRRLRRAG